MQLAAARLCWLILKEVVMDILLNGILWAFLRRWYGGLEFKIQLLNKRFVKTIVMVTAMTAVLVYDWSSPKLIAISLLYALWIQFQFWSRAVGAILDCGRNHTQTKRNYNRWYVRPLN